MPSPQAKTLQSAIRSFEESKDGRIEILDNRADEVELNSQKNTSFPFPFSTSCSET